MFDNSHSKLIKKMEIKLGTKLMNLPKNIDKNTWWEDCITVNTLPSFSRLYPYKLNYILFPAEDKVTRNNNNNGNLEHFYYIDEHRLPGKVNILGLKDLSHEMFLKSFMENPYMYDSPTAYNNGATYSPFTIAEQQVYSDISSLYNSGLKLEYKKPNMIRLTCGNYNDFLKFKGSITLELYVEHNSLITISPMKMETFEKLCLYDIQDYLYQSLKFFDGIESVYGGSIDLKLDEWSQAHERRDTFIDELSDKFINAGNEYIPLIMCI